VSIEDQVASGWLRTYCQFDKEDWRIGALMDVAENRFEVRLASSADEIMSAQRLRYRVFVEEMGASPDPADRARRLERDRFDPHFDHLILLDNENRPSDPLDRVIGVYRLMRKDAAIKGEGFYGASEYDLTPLLKGGREIVELGRSCVDAAYRGGAAMHFLWNGLAEYVLTRKIEIMFGVASFHGTDTQAIAQALSYLHAHHLAPDDLRVTTLPEYFVAMDIIPPAAIERKTALKQIPALIKAYLRLGGFVGDGAYVDRAFNTTDVCLLMDTTRMTARYRDYYTQSHGVKAG